VKIALVADEDPGWGGIGTYTGVLGHALAELGHDVRLVLRGWEGEGVERIDGLLVHRVTVPEPHWYRGTVAITTRLYVARQSLIFSARVARVLARIAPDIVEAPEFHAPALTATLRARVGRRSPAVVVRLHAPSFVTARLAREPPNLDQRAGEVLEAASVHCARLVTAPSRALATIVARRWHLASTRVQVIPNPIDDDLFAPSSQDAETQGRILVVGRIERAKGQDLLIEALPEIRRVVPEAHLLVVGADGGSLAELERRASALGLQEAIRFTGARERRSLPSFYRSASVCVVPSRFEAFSYTALEAMACGKAVLAARVGGLAEVIDDERDGILIEPESPPALAEQITRMLLDAPQRARLGRAARVRVLHSFAARAVAAEMVQHYAKAIR